MKSCVYVMGVALLFQGFAMLPDDQDDQKTTRVFGSSDFFSDGIFTHPTFLPIFIATAGGATGATGPTGATGATGGSLGPVVLTYASISGVVISADEGNPYTSSVITDDGLDTIEVHSSLIINSAFLMSESTLIVHGDLFINGVVSLSTNASIQVYGNMYCDGSSLLISNFTLNGDSNITVAGTLLIKNYTFPGVTPVKIAQPVQAGNIIISNNTQTIEDDLFFAVEITSLMSASNQIIIDKNVSINPTGVCVSLSSTSVSGHNIIISNNTGAPAVKLEASGVLYSDVLEFINNSATGGFIYGMVVDGTIRTDVIKVSTECDFESQAITGSPVAVTDLNANIASPYIMYNFTGAGSQCPIIAAITGVAKIPA